MLFRRALCVLQGALSLSSLAAARALPALSEGKVRSFDLTLTWQKGAPDGVERDMVFINNQFPGPLLEINEGDDVEIVVHNSLPFNTTMHFHGIEQKNTPWSDGTPGITQRQIKTGATFTYRWKATQYGAYWYHAHERGQIDDGFFGPLIIHPSTDEDKPFNLISTDPKTVAALNKAEAYSKQLLLSDWRHTPSEQAWAVTVASGIETACYDSILFNGKGRVDCWSAAKIDALLTPEQRALLAADRLNSFTPKGCLPARVFADIFAAGSETDLSVIPSSFYDVCSATKGKQEVLEFQQTACDDTSTWIAIDIIATFSMMSGMVSVDGHQLYVYAVDGSYIEPQIVEAIPIFNGNRYSAFLKMDKPGDVTVRFASTVEIQVLAAEATIRLNESKSSSRRKRDSNDAEGHRGGPGGEPGSGRGLPGQGDDSNSSGGGAHAGSGDDGTEPLAQGQYIDDAGQLTSKDVTVFNQAAMHMYPAEQVATTADQTFVMHMRNDGKSYIWALNTTMFPPQLDNSKPMLFDPPEKYGDVTITTLNDTWIDVIFVTASRPMPPHPIHKHGNKMWLLGEGMGDFIWNTIDEAKAAMPQAFSFDNPPKRDSFMTPPATIQSAWMAVRYHVTEPGAWFMHCHITWHLLGGMGVAILDGIDHWPTVPEEYLTMA